MNEKTKEFLEKFKDYEPEDIRKYFGDIFTEFINELNNVDLSEKTLEHLNDIFEKDMNNFFEIIKKKKLEKYKNKLYGIQGCDNNE